MAATPLVALAATPLAVTGAMAALAAMAAVAATWR
jgi:hypothetical protein